MLILKAKTKDELITLANKIIKDFNEWITNNKYDKWVNNKTLNGYKTELLNLNKNTLGIVRQKTHTT